MQFLSCAELHVFIDEASSNLSSSVLLTSYYVDIRSKNTWVDTTVLRTGRL